jgi:hypothetical protein
MTARRGAVLVLRCYILTGIEWLQPPRTRRTAVASMLIISLPEVSWTDRSCRSAGDRRDTKHAVANVATRIGHSAASRASSPWGR